MPRLICFLICLLVLPAQAITVEVDGRQLPAEPAPLMSHGRVSVPMRAIFQALGAKVDYRAGVITAARGSDSVILKLGSTQARLNGRPVTLDVAPQLEGGHTYVPLRFVGQALGEKVTWEPQGQRVVVGEAVAVAPDLTTKLKQLAVGNQGGVLKVWDASRQQVLYYRGLDDRSTARLSVADRDAIVRALQLDVTGLGRSLMDGYASLPQREALALLAVVPGSAAQRRFLVDRMLNDSQVANRRQAVLALAVADSVDLETVEAVLKFYAGSENLWETFPVQQFFEYHAHTIRNWPQAAQIKARASSVNSLYRDNILSYL